MEQALDLNLIIGIAFGILGIVLIVLWITVPFAIFGIKQRLDETNRHLKVIVERLKSKTRAKPSSKKPVKTRAGGRVSQLYRGIVENDEDD